MDMSHVKAVLIALVVGILIKTLLGFWISLLIVVAVVAVLWALTKSRTGQRRTA